LNNLRDTKKNIINKLEGLIKECLSNYYITIGNYCKINTEIYGSFASGLAIESSDIDISVKYPDSNKEDITLLMSKVVDCLKLTGTIEGMTPIYTASVPVIKLVTI